MSDEILISKVELDNLNERVKKLAIEKSYLQVFIHLMNEMSTVSGLENTIQKLLQIILGNIGGSNLIIYYIIDDEIFYADVLGEKKALEQIEDDIVKKVFETMELIEIQSDFTDTKLLGTEFTTASTWAFPLLVGNDLIGVLKIEDLYTGTADLHFHLPTFFSYAAHILKNEILGHTKLKSAFDLLTGENNLRKQAEEELKIINEELENRVEERTLELHHLNLQLEEELAVRQNAEVQILKLNRILSVLSEINQAIVRIHDSGKILNEACRIAIENGKFQMAWIGMVNFQTNKVDVAASYGISGDYLENIDINLTDELRSNGPTGIAVKTGKHKISNNINNDESMLPWREKAIKYGYKSSASFPLSVFDKVIGAFNIYSDEYEFFQEDDITLLDEMAKDISFALEFIESENERKHAEEALVTSEQELRNLAESSPGLMGTFYLRPDGNICMPYTSPQIHNLFGLSSEDVVEDASSLLDRTHPEDVQMVNESIAESARTMTPWHCEYRVLHPTRGELWMEGYTNPKPHPDGGIIWYGFVHDITERKKAEQKITLMSFALNHVNEAAFLIDENASFRYVNENACHILGYTNDELLKMSVYDVDPGFTISKWTSHWNELKNNRALTLEGNHKTKDGRLFPVEINANYLKYDGNSFNMALVRDISDRKLMENALFFVAQRGWQTGEESFFDALVLFLGENLNMDYVLIDKLDQDPVFAETIALYAKGSIVPNMRYALKGTPCENVMGRQLCFYPQEVQKLFPEDTLLIEMDVECYIGIPLWDSSGKPIGLIALMSCKPHPEDSSVIQLLQLVATRAAAELERERSEQILRKREYEFRTLTENLPDNIVRYDRQCRAIYCNTKMIQTLSVKPEIMFGKTPLEFGAGGLEVDTEYELRIRRALESGESSDLEIVMPHPDGGFHNHLIRFVPERDTEGSIIGVLAIGQDITARKRAEESLRESEEKYRAVADYTYDWETWMDAKGNFIYVSPACERITGYSAGEFMDNPNLFNDIVFKEDSDSLTQHKQLSEKDDSVHQKEFRITTKSGGVRWIEHICRSIFNSDGKWIGRRASNREITERKRNDALNASRLHLMNYAAVHSFDDFIEESLNVIEKFTESKISFYVFVEDDQQSVILQDWSTRTKAEFCKAEGRGFHYNISDAGVWIDCVIQRKAIIHNDYASLPHRKGLPEGHAELIRELVVPVFRGDKIKAVVAVGNKAQNYTESDVESATLLASLSWEIAERKRSELSLRESERRLTEAQRIANIGYWERDFISNKIILSDESCRIFGLTQENYYRKLDDWHKQLLQLLLPEDKERVEKAFMDAVQNDIPYNLDYRIVRHDGELRHVHSEANVRRDSSGLPLIMLGMMQDITDRKRAEESIRESETKLRVMFENSRDAIGVSKKGVHVFANPAYLKLFGYEKLEDIVGTLILDCIAPSHHQQIIENVKRRASGEDVLSFYETRGRKRDGSEFDFEINISSYELNGEDFTLANIRDITDRKQAELQLSESEKKYRLLVEYSPYCIHQVNRQGHLISMNRAGLRMMGVENEDDIQGMMYLDAVANEDKERIDQLLANALHGQPGEFEFKGINGNIYQSTFVPITDSGGEVLWLMGLTQNITERKQSEIQLRNSEREYRTLAENIPDHIMRYDLNCRAVYINHGMESTKFTKSSLIGKLPTENKFAGGDGVEIYNEKLSRVIKTGKEEEMEFILPDLEGNIHIHEVHFLAERNIDGEITGAMTIAHNITELKMAEETLRQAADEILDLYNHAPCGYHSLDPDGLFVRINETELEWLGYERNEVLGKMKFTDLLTATSLKTFEKNFPNFKKSGIIQELEFEMICKDGSILTTLVSATALTDKNGNYLMSRSTVYDISERKQIEEVLRQSEERYRLIAENTADTIAVLDMNLLPIYVSPSVERMRGYTVQEVMSLSLEQSLTPESLKKVNDTLAEEIALEKSGKADPSRNIMLELEEYCKDGSVIWIELSASFLRDDNFKPFGILTVTRDITERKLAEETRKTVLDKLNEAQRIANLGSWELNLLNDHLTWSNEIFNIFEIDPEKFGATYEAFLAVIHPEDREAVNAAYTNSLESRQPYSIDHRLLFPEGRIKFVHEECKTFYDEYGKPVRSVGTVQDITERKLAEEEILKLNTELEKRVRDRTASLEAANKELEAFSYSVSHDLRAPLRHIDGFLTLLKEKMETNLDKESTHYMAIILKAAKRMDILIEDLLSFSRMGRYELSRMKVNLNLLVHDVIQEFEPDLLNRKINWHIAELPVVSGDSSMLRIVLVNLISNSLKFTRFRLQAEIEIGCIADQQSEITIFVRDNGVGFDMNYSDRLFGVFQRLHSNEEFEGTGIGLANVHRIISRHGGKTWGVGEINKGATFYFTIPEGVPNEK